MASVYSSFILLTWRSYSSWLPAACSCDLFFPPLYCDFSFTRSLLLDACEVDLSIASSRESVAFYCNLSFRFLSAEFSSTLDFADRSLFICSLSSILRISSRAKRPGPRLTGFGLIMLFSSSLLTTLMEPLESSDSYELPIMARLLSTNSLTANYRCRFLGRPVLRYILDPPW